jgi:hypothetical protein
VGSAPVRHRGGLNQHWRETAAVQNLCADESFLANVAYGKSGERSWI